MLVQGSNLREEFFQVGTAAIDFGGDGCRRFENRDAPRDGVHEDLRPAGIVDAFQRRQQWTETQFSAIEDTPTGRVGPMGNVPRQTIVIEKAEILR